MIHGRRRFGILLCLAVLTSSHGASAFFGGATEFTQLLNNAELVALAGQSGVQIDNQLVQISHQVEQIHNQLRIYENMLQNTEKLPTALWGNVESDLRRLQAITQQGNALAFSMSNVDQVLGERFASYSQQMSEQLAEEGFTALYESWSETNRDTIAGTLAAAGAAAQQINDEEGLMSELRAMSGSSVGQMQALEVGHQLAGQQIAQMQKLRSLVSQQMVMMGTWYQSEQAARDLAQTRRDRFFGASEAYPTEGGQDMEPRF